MSDKSHSTPIVNEPLVLIDTLWGFLKGRRSEPKKGMEDDDDEERQSKQRSREA